MKRNLFTALLFAVLLSSCSDDDNDIVGEIPTTPEPTADADVRLNEVQYLGDWVEIRNNGNETVDLSDYFLCLGPGTYQRLSDLTVNGNLQLAAGAMVSVAYEMPNATGGLGLYNSNSDFTDASTLADFVQWGAGSSARENVAVEAGIWTAGDFVPVMGNSDNTLIYDGNGIGVANWAETTTPTIGEENQLTVPEEIRSIVINEVLYGSRDLVELYNNGNVAVDLSSYWMCLGPGNYVQLGNVTPESGNLELAAGEFLVVPFSLPDTEGGLGLYSSNAFTSSEAIMDFVQWGAASSPRENVAVEAGIWTAGEFVPTVALDSYSIEYDGEGDEASDWTQEVNPSLGFANDTEVALTTFNVTISNVINYLNVHTFTTPVGAGAPGPLATNGAQYQISFKAVPGTKFTPVTMMGNSNDWFLAPTDLAGIDLFPNGQALNGVDIASQLSLYDLGTEADNDVASFPPAGLDVGAADANTAVRLVDGRDTGDIYITAILDYTNGDGFSAGTFTLTITAINTPDPGQPAGSNNGFVVTPGIVVLHAQSEPLFTLGEEDRGVGLERIAEDGMPGELYNWFTATGSNGSPLRLASSLSVFSPGIVYAFNTNSDPFFAQGGTVKEGSGLEEIAEDGNNAVAVSYFNNLGLPVAASNETAPIGPGEYLSFTIDVPQDQDYKLGISTMLVQTNDWFISYNNNGVALFDETGTPFSGTSESDESYLFDAGTEEDEPVGFGMYQAPRQAGPDMGPADANTTIRRVSALEDVQFGKGIYNNGPGVVYLEDPRGGYNLVRIDIQPQ
ncbi:lamin tail domain-containing protein [Muricauda sp. 2012CJ35-5]|uniref:Lamin tail domain-containing protein n=1 Tax=Flagellimonas spongiicola TaxID=2942208 RepID=A0ABT0PV22_9FLAO|nr:spondin domain-containing protein [Allomuricauda spongiicola]MCL6275224.1 lamin tail domain-containing protein [Allomuricauda spongiicola]